MRRRLNFVCEGARCAASLDEGAATTGLLIVSGGNEVLAGAHRGMAALASAVAAEGFPVLRYDRRGIGDSDGENGGFRSSSPDIAAAVATFRAEAGVQRIVAFGNCDAATALALYCARSLPDSGIGLLLLANPWSIDDVDLEDVEDQAPPMPTASAIRARYLARIRDPQQWWRLLTGGVDLRKLFIGLRAAGGTADTKLTGLGAELIDAFDTIIEPARILLASRDRTAIAFRAAFASAPAAVRNDYRILEFDTGSHGFADDAARDWLKVQVLNALAET